MARERVTDADGQGVTTNKLMADLRMLSDDTEELLKATASQTGEHLAQARAKVEESLKAAKARVADLQDSARARTRAAGQVTDDYVRANPWQVMVLCALGGFVLGTLLARRGTSDSEQPAR